MMEFEKIERNPSTVIDWSCSVPLLHCSDNVIEGIRPRRIPKWIHWIVEILRLRRGALHSLRSRIIIPVVVGYVVVQCKSCVTGRRTTKLKNLLKICVSWNVISWPPAILQYLRLKLIVRIRRDLLSSLIRLRAKMTLHLNFCRKIQKNSKNLTFK